jgi:glycosyltransferase involved in cell wall biosynthesis
MGLRLPGLAALAGGMRILLVTETLLAGGAETFVLRLANALAANHEVTIAVLHGELTNEALAAKVDAGVGVERLTLPAKRLLFKLDSLVRRLGLDWSVIRTLQHRWLAALVQRSRPDVIHSHLLKADWAASDIRAAYPAIRHVITLHGDYAPFIQAQADPQMLDLERRMKAIVGGADAIAAICRAQVDWVAKTFPQAGAKTELIYNGFAPWGARARRDFDEGARPLVFGMVSRGVEQKGWAKAIAAFGTLPRGLAELVLVGEGPFLDTLRSAPLPDGVRFTGFSADPLDWIERFDVGLLPSEFPHESLPTVVMEYLFCGKPVIATDVGEIAEMLRAPDGGQAGTLLDFADGRISIGQLAAAMRAYVEDPALRRRHAALAPAAFAKFDMELCGAAYARLYGEAGGEAINSATSSSH